MMPFSDRMYPDFVRIKAKTLPQATGRVAGNRDAYGEPGPKLSCCFRFLTDNQSYGLPGTTTNLAGTATFPGDPGCKRDDLIIRGDGEYRVTDRARPQDESGESWIVTWIKVD